MKYALSVALVALSLLVAGCASGPQTTGVLDPFIGGTEGLAISFQQGTPPAEIFDNGDSEFAIGIRIQNNGEADVGADPIVPNDNRVAFVELSGINPLQFSSPIMLKELGSEGVTMTRMRKNFDGSLIAGVPDVMLFEGFRFLPDIVGNQEIRIRANLCYDYTTFANTQICLKSSTLETLRDNAICTLTGPRDVKNSGAPVHVSSFQQYPLGRDRIGISFTIENKNMGEIFAPSEFSQGFIDPFAQTPCDTTSPNNPNRNRVYVRVRLNDESSNALIACNRLQNTNEGMVTLFSGAPAIVQCTLEVPPGVGNQAYVDTLRIDLDYMYHQFVQTPILVRDVSAGIQ